MILQTSKYNKTLLKNDFYKPIRNYSNREKMFEFIMSHFDLKSKKISYLEFGVAGGLSFEKFLSLNDNKESKFYGFDTFEGLPENWGSFFKKGDMNYGTPNLSDNRGLYIKGLFQETLINFLDEKDIDLKESDIRIIHMDADLYSATIFALSQIHRYLKKGDIIFFDEYSVPMHEFKAFKEFNENHYIKFKPLTAVNNYYQMAFMIE